MLELLDDRQGASRWLRMVRELEEGKSGRKPLLEEPEGILSKWGLALEEQDNEGKGKWQVDGYAIN